MMLLTKVKKSVPKLIYLKKSYELVEYLKISLNNVIISNESFINRSSLVSYIYIIGRMILLAIETYLKLFRQD